MFTNWLTGTTGSNSVTGNAGTPTARGNVSNGNAVSVNAESAMLPVGTVAEAAAAAAAAAGSVASSIMSTPPDVVLEVGPTGPTSVRFVAHSIVLGMHSGYLRSAIRLDENAAVVAAGNELVLYLGNVTAEQFGPLLTYMYTGYLDLNVENIFGVLLATHVLHMPRALEICRSFLAQAQSEGYLGSNPLTAQLSGAANSSSKVIRPIPSKATLPNFGFVPLPTTYQLQQSQTAIAPNNSENFKQLPQVYENTAALVIRNRCGGTLRPPSSIEIDIDRTSPIQQADVDDDDEDVEVFIDNNTESDADGELDCTISVISHSSQRDRNTTDSKHDPRDNKVEHEIILTVAEAPVTLAKARSERDKEIARIARNKSTALVNEVISAHNTCKRDRRKQTRTHHKAGGSRASGLQVAKAPIPASQLDNNESSKVIIDVASCDGPVRFRRILNTAYGHKPENYAVMPERTQQSVSLSFHQQMAKAISQHRKYATAHEESENSESIGGAGNTASVGGIGNGKHNKNANNEIYVCVYCKHTFKSQYCYQKHAKRHLNPLSLNCAAAAASATNLGITTDIDDKATPSAKSASSSGAEYDLTGGAGIPIPIAANKQGACELLRREVRPLDMNVQYYPCKTCGSKFPSYYFVHKHRKMCHAEEEAAAAAEAASKRENGNGNGAAGNGGESKLEKSTENPMD
ncbi:uncharacterized protein [Bactrocera oleae]|uniref:uncharacterized protein n=1 Tax=Bactrocera oleae TaxID=104688 RepID=UPI00387EE1EA